MAIVKYKNQSGVTYAYESIPVWDAEKKQSRPKRVYLGRVDDETGEIISTPRKKGRPRKERVGEENTIVDEKDYKTLYSEASRRVEVLTLQIAEEKKRTTLLEAENRKLLKALKDVSVTVTSVLENKEN